MKKWKGAIVAEGLSDPTVINKLSVYEATISEANMPIDYEGHVGRWHGYRVSCSREEIDALQPYILPGWYAHFWKADRIIVVYYDKQFELLKGDKGRRREAIEHGRAQGIHYRGLSFSPNLAKGPIVPTSGSLYVPQMALTGGLWANLRKGPLENDKAVEYLRRNLTSRQSEMPAMTRSTGHAIRSVGAYTQRPCDKVLGVAPCPAGCIIP